MTAHQRTLTPAEQQLVDDGLATLYHGRLIPIIRGGSEDGGDGGDGGSGTGEGEGGTGDGGDGGRTFTQQDVDRIVQERLARVKTSPPADYDDLKAKAAEFDKLQEANKTELEKAQERAARLERDHALTAERYQRAITDSAIVAEAAKRGIDTDIAKAMIDRASLEFDDDGNPTNIASAMDALLEAKPNLAATGGEGRGANGSADQGARGGGKHQIKSTDGMSAEEIAAAVADGRLDEYLKTPTA